MEIADSEQVKLLTQGVNTWNQWRKKNLDAKVVLTQANFDTFNLEKAFLSEADLRRVSLIGTDLRSADLSRANLNGADLRGADLRGADLSEADLRGADLGGSNFGKAVVGDTTFGKSNLSEVIGLDEIIHHNPSNISTDTFVFSKGKIPETFLRGCGLSDVDIEYAKLSNLDLSNEEINKILYNIYDLRAGQAVQVSPLFVSYNRADGTFVDKLEDPLNEKGIRFWRDIHDAKAGRLEKAVDRAMRLNPTVLLILSEHSLKSDWVEHEVRTARQLEKEMGRDVLCPVALDDSWKNSAWPRRVMEQVMEYNILDFSEWKDDSKFGSIFNKLIDGLELFYKG